MAWKAGYSLKALEKGPGPVHPARPASRLG
jgi:hypothetical protein